MLDKMNGKGWEDKQRKEDGKRNRKDGVPSTETECEFWVWFSVSFGFGEETLGEEGCWVVIDRFVHRDTSDTITIRSCILVVYVGSGTYAAFAIMVDPFGMNMPR